MIRSRLRDAPCPRRHKPEDAKTRRNHEGIAIAWIGAGTQVPGPSARLLVTSLASSRLRDCDVATLKSRLAMETGNRLPRRRGIPDPRREAMWLLARAWGVEEITLRLHPEREVPAEVEARYRSWLERRAAGEPAHHLTGECEFWGRDFMVSPAVLVPTTGDRARDPGRPRSAPVADGAGARCRHRLRLHRGLFGG